MQRASELRGLGFREPVVWRRISRNELRAIVRRELEAQYDPGFVEAYRDAYAAMGLIRPEVELLEALLDLLETRLVGLYSRERGTLYVVDDVDAAADAGRSMILVHELVHALQDQHFPETLALLQTLRDNDDLALAIASSVEGDASLTMFDYDSAHPLGRSHESALRFQAQVLDEVEQADVAPKLPRLLRVAQAFPYAYGTPWAAEVYLRSGNHGLDRALREPPLSTLHVRYPSTDRPVEFLRLPLAELQEVLGPRGCEVGHSNVAGSLSLEVLLTRYGAGEDAPELLRAWTGDRFVQLDCPGGWELAWWVRWTDAEAAASFARRYGTLADKIARSAPLSGPPSVIQRGRDTLVLTPGLRKRAELLLERGEAHAYTSFQAWLDEGCFPDRGCPGLGSSRQSRK